MRRVPVTLVGPAVRVWAFPPHVLAEIAAPRPFLYHWDVRRIGSSAYHAPTAVAAGADGVIFRISSPPPGASSVSNSSGTGEFPFGTGRGDAAPGGVATVSSAAALDDHPFSTN
jgi:hypothetical protein